MSVLLSVLAVAFAALCVWLTVRIVNRRERWAKRLAVGLVLGVPVLYVLGFGLFVWLFHHDGCSEDSIPLATARQVYYPISWLLENGPQPIRSAIEGYYLFWQ